MKKLADLKLLFTIVAVLEFFYFAAAMMPPSWIRPVTGWELNADGHWITKLLGLALGIQAYIAWIFRKNPSIGLAKGLAFYQVTSATIDWVMWSVMKDEGIFNNSLAQFTVIAAIVSHYILGILLFIGISKTQGSE
ncbi:MAG: hypothetical protein FD123_4182 [Bacteroidetes bacterium]|nr:MAG: hypothetical protein FD123_4182 [Bacteroidota bacterium]